MKVAHGWAFPEADEFMAKELKEDGTYQASHLYMALDFVKDFSLAIDGGAHVGTWSRLLSERFTKVIAVEPCEDTREALTENMRTHGCENVEIKGVAISQLPGFVSMELDGRGLEMKNTGARHVSAGKDVVCETIDGWNLESCGFIKLDIEGSEALALGGARQTLLRCKPIVLFEDKFLWKRYGQHREAPHRVLRAVNYRHLVRAGMDEIWGPA